MMPNFKLVLRFAACLLPLFFAAGCRKALTDEGNGGRCVLTLSVEVAGQSEGTPDSCHTKGYADPEAGELMERLRIIIVRPNGIVEHNRLVNLAVSSLKSLDNRFKVVNNEDKDIYLIANENNPKNSVDFSSFVEGSVCSRESMNSLILQLSSNDDIVPSSVPISAHHVVRMPLTDYSTDLYVLRGVTKYTYEITNSTPFPLHLSSLKIDKAAWKEYFFPAVKSFKSVENGEIDDFDVPLVGNEGYYTFSRKLDADITSGSTAKLAPFFLLEGKYTRSGAGRNYSTTLTVNGMDYTDYLSEIDLLPRNTHIVVRITFKSDGSSVVPEMSASVLPYSSVELNPGFGQ